LISSSFARRFGETLFALWSAIMPIYEYVCQSCGHELELIQKISDAAPTDCPECAKPELKKRISAAGFQLKGSGWYVTDFKGGSKKKDKGESGGESSGDATPAKTGGCGGGSCGCH
jgi:putative FmdB family regulatory protein